MIINLNHSNQNLSLQLNVTVKVVIKGERNTGKTCLFNMLQRKRFIEEYVPTPEIQAATIDWSFKCKFE